MVLKNQLTSSRRDKTTSDIECLDAYESDDEGFMEGDIVTGKVLSTFTFGASTAPEHNQTLPHEPIVQKKLEESNLPEKQTYTITPRGLTPPVNGEHYTVKRSYQMRASTVRKLNELKAEHADVNILFNTIVDMAISHYHKYIFNESGPFKLQ